MKKKVQRKTRNLQQSERKSLYDVRLNIAKPNPEKCSLKIDENEISIFKNHCEIRPFRPAEPNRWSEKQSDVWMAKIDAKTTTDDRRTTSDDVDGGQQTVDWRNEDTNEERRERTKTTKQISWIEENRPAWNNNKQ